MTVRILTGDCRDVMATLPGASVHCCVTSPPYFGLRDYGVAGQRGMEATPAEFVENLVLDFREVRRLLRDDGTLWLNIGDSYANDTKWGGRTSGKHAQNLHGNSGIGRRRTSSGCKSKELMGIPWQLAFALSADGWYLRQDIIWHKPNPMPESVTDRCTKAHEYLFLLSKSERYWFDAAAIAEDAVGQNEHDRTGQGYAAPGQTPNRGNRRNTFDRSGNAVAAHVLPGQSAAQHRPRVNEAERKALRTNTESRHRASIPGGQSMQAEPNGKRNKRSVWTIATKPFAEAHFATMAPELAETCIKAGCPVGGTVLDPFGGAGTTGLVADGLQREAVLIELNPAYIEIAHRRIAADAPLLADVSVGSV